MAKSRSVSLSGLSIADLQAEITRRAGSVGKMVAERDALMARAHELDSQIRFLGGTGMQTSVVEVVAAPAVKRGRGRPKKNPGAVAAAPAMGGVPAAAKPKRGRGRPVNDNGLVPSLVKVMQGKIMSVMEAAEAVKAAGYKTNAVNFRVIVNQAFIKHTDKFRKVAHGKYTAK